jgi:hypothetical protein
MTKSKTKRVKEIKMKSSCIYCQEADVSLLQFHHRDHKEKLGNISEMCHHGKVFWEVILEEINKCDLVCPTCHLKLHKDIKMTRIPDMLKQLNKYAKDY